MQRRTLLADPTPTGNEILDEASTWIANADRPRMPSYWVGRLAGIASYASANWRRPGSEALRARASPLS